MRCLTLANVLKRRGASVRFVCRHLPESMSAAILQAGHEVTLLHSSGERPSAAAVAYADLLGDSPAQDARDTLGALQDRQWDWLVVDHYGIDAAWESAVRAAAIRIMVIDDTADRDHDCDVLLDQNLFRESQARYRNRVGAQTILLLGPQYALLRPQFLRMRELIRPRTGAIGRLFVMYGGTDPQNLTGRALTALGTFENASFAVDVVIGGTHSHRGEIERICLAQRYQCHVDTDRVAELMAVADLALGAGGSASWERCCVALPAICVSFADNQLHIANALQEEGGCIFLGDHRQVSSQQIAAAVDSLMSDPQRLRQMSARAFSLVDGRGSERVCNILGEAA